MKLDAAYLTTQTSREEVESRIDFASAPTEFGSDWERLLAKMQPGDEFWCFEPPEDKPHLIEKYYRVWGVALVREGKVISTLLEALD